MLYLIAVIFPPFAVMACGKPWQWFFVSLPLTLLFWIPGVLHAWAVVSAYRTQPTFVIANAKAAPAQGEGGLFTSLCFFLIGAGIALYWMGRAVVLAPN